MTILPKHAIARRNLMRDVRPASVRIADYWGQTKMFAAALAAVSVTLIVLPEVYAWSDIALFCVLFYARWMSKRPFVMPFKFPKNAGLPDKHNAPPGKSGAGKSEGILYLGVVDDAENPDHGRELWLTNSDARTHILFLGTTGSGKTEGLKSLVVNSLAWGSGFVYVDGKADTDLWASLYAIARRFGRDDDLLVLNYMTANSDSGAVSNTMNPFANGSASYLTNMVTSLMPDAGGDNAMWKERAVALMGALMPALTFKRDKQGLLLDVGVLREYIELKPIIRLSRDQTLPERVLRALRGYLNTLPGFVDAAFDDEGNEKPPSPEQPMYDLSVARQQHGYLSMQFTRSLQSLGDEYGYIFKAQLADVDVLDVVLNRRILVGLIPALEKSGDEAANLGKIVAASLKGMMGATLGNTVEGSWESAIGSKQTRSSSSFMTVFDEVGYYTAQGMAVMAAQARSLGFSLIFAAQDLPSMEKRVKQEAQSILGNCNLKIFGKIEDPTETKKFFQEHVGTSWVMENRGMTSPTNTISSLFMTAPFYDDRGAGAAQSRVRADYDHLRTQREGEVHMLFAEYISRARLFHAVADKVKALRVHHMLPVPATTTVSTARERALAELATRLSDKDWKAATASPPAATTAAEISMIADALAEAKSGGVDKTASVLAHIATTAPQPAKAAAASPAKPPLPSVARAASESGFPTQISASQPEGVPLLQSGDEFAIDEISRAEYGNGHAHPNGNGVTAAQSKPFSEDKDLMEAALESKLERSGDEDKDYGGAVLKTGLSGGVMKLLETMADKMNKGLSDRK